VAVGQPNNPKSINQTL
jgi:hypothetical protein